MPRGKTKISPRQPPGPDYQYRMSDLSRMASQMGMRLKIDVIDKPSAPPVPRTIVPLAEVTRLEVIGNGREFTRYDVRVVPSLQDDGRTLKLFLTPRTKVESS